jgi:nitrite reductase/ring-hydroxylating ferredoxin subunit
VRLAAITDLPEGRLRAFTVPGVTWPVLAGVFDGEVIATAGVCPHEDVSLADGDVAAGCLTCPGHGYVFELRTGACVHDRALSLRRYRARIIDGAVWLELV